MESRGDVRFIGIIRVPLVNLHFIEGTGERPYNQKQTDHLEILFRGTSVNHADRRHWIDGYIEQAAEEGLLSDLNLSRSQLGGINSREEYPLVEQQTVAFTQGRHRVDAAKRIDPSSCWTIRLHSTNPYSFHKNRIVRCQTEQYQHEMSNSDGEIYTKLRGYGGDHINFCEWHERLSITKQKAFFYITKRPAITEALDRLIPLKGVFESLHLSYFLKIFDKRLDDELLAGLDNIHKQWSRITDGCRLDLLDKDTVTALEGRAPSVSTEDQAWIASSFQQRRDSSSVFDASLLLKMESCVLAETGLIHSLRSLHMNMEHLGVAAGILWTYLIPKGLRATAKAKQLSLAATLRSCWMEKGPLIEMNEGVFQPARGPPSFTISYVQLLLSALRLFPYLANTKPKVEKGERMLLSIDLHCVASFHQRARMLGFNTSEFDPATAGHIAQCSGQWRQPHATASADEAKLLIRPYHRWGRPYQGVYRIIQTQAFLPTIARLSQTSYVTTAFILRDFVTTFFEPFHFELDSSRPPVYLQETIIETVTQPAVYSHSTALQPIAEATETDCCDARPLVVAVGSGAPMQDIQDNPEFTCENGVDVQANREYGEDEHGAARQAQNLEAESGARKDIIHTCENNVDPDISTPTVARSLSLSCGRDTGTVRRTEKLQHQRQHISGATSISGVSVQNQIAHLHHRIIPQDDQESEQRPMSRLAVTQSAANIEEWRQKVSNHHMASARSSNPPIHRVLENPRFSTSSHGRSTTSRRQHGDVSSISLPSQRRVRSNCSMRRRKWRIRSSRSESPRPTYSTAPIREWPSPSSSRSGAVSQTSLRPPSMPQPSSGISAPFSDVDWDGGNSLPSIPRSSLQYPVEMHTAEPLTLAGKRTNHSAGPQSYMQAATASTSPRSSLPAQWLPGSDVIADGAAPLTPDTNMLHEFLQRQPRGGQRSSNWQGFDDSDDEILSIEL
ncbi:hypothetical protein ISF_09727 [Cordyceps fumosorosea ARSEF 2679]|uniref:Uncharacterized protein n=1 Tax=Cordyceps fumosorosea (strain ARSEF 2679) TaxID=1081104 RepID=A0A167DEK2_CORFA|nr:hypothetical protein ISF_09727 [Cordyceps fumosorosea ARSEF 2679]OAA42287.1 hypothetical protein ISF_09727 [Cordyceps fumosorosea ARSEF 2679]